MNGHRRIEERSLRLHRVVAEKLRPDEISERLADPGETMTALRQCSPFAGALEARERWQILRRAREAQNR